MAHTAISDGALRELTARVKRAQEQFAKNYPGETGTRQPVHTVYGGAQLFKSDTTKKLGELALKAMGQYAPNATAFAEGIGIHLPLADRAHPARQEKLNPRARDDFPIHFRH